MELSAYFNELIATQKAPFAIVAPPRWAMTVFRIEPKGQQGSTQSQLDDLNRRFYNALQTRDDVLLLTQTILPEVGFCVRLVVGTSQTRREHVESAYKIICDVANETLATQ